MGFGSLLSSWWSLVVLAVALVVVLSALAHSAGVPLPGRDETYRQENKVWLMVAHYFCVTLLIYFSALSLRFCLVDL
jgi:hypothetical protein